MSEARTPSELLDQLGDRRFSHYQVLEMIGRGGMGVVYRAIDVQLDRPVALKFMDPSRTTVPGQKRRFQREARATSSINHPNVAHVYEIGEAEGLSFIAMEYVEGEPLDRKLHGRALNEADVVHLGIQIADAVAAAHAKGIVHRDLKPSNILVMPSGFLKVLDFGLAKAVHKNEVERDHTATVTRPGLILGTVEYMSPEQALGQSVDVRSDLFSVGTILYEMATGVVPFGGESPTEILSRIITSEPDAVARYNYSVSAQMERIIRKCLEKDPARRYQTAAEIAVDLRNLERDRPSGRTPASPQRHARLSRRAVPLTGSTLAAAAAGTLGLRMLREQSATPPLDTLAVLPELNLTGDPGLDYLADGITENLINALASLPLLSVRSRNSVQRYKQLQLQRDLDPNTVARDLNVKAAVTGRISLQDGALVLSAELTDIVNDKQVWGEQHRQTRSSIFQAQDAVAREIASHLNVSLTAEDRARLKRTTTADTGAFHLYMHGRFFWNKRTAADLRKAIEYFNQAIEKDGNFALAWAGLADSWMLLGTGVVHPRDAFPRARAAAKKAIELDPDAGEPHATLGYVGLHYDWNWAETEATLKRALRLSPRYPLAHSVYARYLSVVGRFEDAIAEMKQALDLDPLAMGASTGLGLCYYLARRFEQATEQYRRTLEVEPRFTLAWFNLGTVCTQLARYNDAIESFNKGLELSKTDAGAIAELGYTYARAGRRNDARSCLQRVAEISKQRYVAPYFPALAYAGLGDTDNAFRLPEDAWKDRSSPLVFLKVDPRWDVVRSDSRYADIVRRLALA